MDKQYFCIGDRVHYIGLNKDCKLVSLYKEPEPDGTPVKSFWCDVEFDDGTIWISQDAFFDVKKNGNDTIVLK